MSGTSASAMSSACRRSTTYNVGHVGVPFRMASNRISSTATPKKLTKRIWNRTPGVDENSRKYLS